MESSSSPVDAGTTPPADAGPASLVDVDIASPVDAPLLARGTPGPEPLRAFVCTATGGSYFRIWIVNLLLSVVTIGLYSPWAKVRRLRYFYRNTSLDGSSFEFHGRPLALLKGRLIGIVLLVAYSQSAEVSPLLWIAVVVLLVALLPWLFWKSLRFRFANSSYRGIRFAFDGTRRQAYLTFVPLVLVVLAPSVLNVALPMVLAPDETARTVTTAFVGTGVALVLAPWFYFRLRAYQHRNVRLGASSFTFEARVRSAYWLAFKIALLMLGFGVLAGAAAGLVSLAHLLSDSPIFGAMSGRPRTILTPMFMLGAAYLVLLSGLSQPVAMIQNFVWNHSTLNDGRFDSAVHRSRLWRILFGNLVLTLVTAGLFWPFAVVRQMRYRIDSVSWSGGSETLLAAMDDAKIGATGEETAELFGLDIAL